jgi:hypothetical protein
LREVLRGAPPPPRTNLRSKLSATHRNAAILNPLEAPYDLGIVEGAYDWTDGKEGLCVYCTHCLMIYEQAPIDRAGWPFLVVEPPTPSTPADDRRCQYTIYKRPEDVPVEVYERSGRVRPGDTSTLS